MNVKLGVADRVTRVAPLGIRFWDTVTNSPVRDGLQLVLYPSGQPWLQMRAEANPSGVFVLHDGPGLGRVTRGSGDDRYWHEVMPSALRCEVSDSRARFHPFSFSARLPTRGLFALDGVAPSAQGVELFSAPTRAMPGAMAVIRAQLTDANTGLPAAWSLLKAEYRGTELGRGVADRRGQLVLAFPFPEPERQVSQAASSPPGPAGILMKWEVRLRVFYTSPGDADSIPDYCRVITQPEARLLAAQSPPQPPQDTVVMLGREFVYPSPDNPRLFVESL